MDWDQVELVLVVVDAAMFFVRRVFVWTRSDVTDGEISRGGTMSKKQGNQAYCGSTDMLDTV